MTQIEVPMREKLFAQDKGCICEWIGEGCQNWWTRYDHEDCPVNHGSLLVPGLLGDLRPDRWLRELLIAIYVAAMGVVFALNFPEPVDCQREGETATFAEGCQP